MINSFRIQEICNQVSSKVIAEIGCDHAYITKNLLDNKKIEFAYLTDISNKCLEKAKNNLKEYKNKTFFSTGNGLKALNVTGEQIKKQKTENLQPPLQTLNKNLTKIESLQKISYPEVGQVIIAGMGGQEIIKILSQPEAKNYKNFILQPQSNVIELKKYLQENNFEIISDEIAQEDKMFYFVLNVVKTNKQCPISTNQLYFGASKNKETLKNYLNFKLKKCLEISEKIKTAENETLIQLINAYLKTLN